MLQKVEYTLSDNGTVFRIDKEGFSSIDVTGLKEGSSTLTADITCRVGAKTFTKTISKEIKVKNPPQITFAASVISGSAVDLAVQIDQVNIIGSTDNTDQFAFFEADPMMYQNGFSLSSDGKDGKPAQFDLTSYRENLEYETVIDMCLKNGDALNMILKIKLTQKEDGTYEAAVTSDHLVWTGSKT